MLLRRVEIQEIVFLGQDGSRELCERNSRVSGMMHTINMSVSVPNTRQPVALDKGTVIPL